MILQNSNPIVGEYCHLYKLHILPLNRDTNRQVPLVSAMPLPGLKWTGHFFNEVPFADEPLTATLISLYNYHNIFIKKVNNKFLFALQFGYIPTLTCIS